MEWFCGFADGESSFIIVRQGNSFKFRFLINLHIDDLNLLHYIKDTLNLGGNP